MEGKGPVKFIVAVGGGGTTTDRAHGVKLRWFIIIVVTIIRHMVQTIQGTETTDSRSSSITGGNKVTVNKNKSQRAEQLGFGVG